MLRNICKKFQVSIPKTLSFIKKNVFEMSAFDVELYICIYIIMKTM